jgi:hypothetical protein
VRPGSREAHASTAGVLLASAAADMRGDAGGTAATRLEKGLCGFRVGLGGWVGGAPRGREDSHRALSLHAPLRAPKSAPCNKEVPCSQSTPTRCSFLRAVLAGLLPSVPRSPSAFTMARSDFAVVRPR